MKDKPGNNVIDRKWYIPKIEDTFIPSLLSATAEDGWLNLIQHKKLNPDLQFRDICRAVLEKAGWRIVKIHIKEISDER